MAKKSTTASGFVTIDKSSANQVSKTKKSRNDVTKVPKKFEINYGEKKQKAVVNSKTGKVTVLKRKENTREPIIVPKPNIGNGKTMKLVAPIKKLKKSTTLLGVLRQRATIAFNMPSELLCSDGDVINYLSSIKL